MLDTGSSETINITLTSYVVDVIIAAMKWTVQFCNQFEEEFDVLNEAVQDQLLAHALLLEKFGPQLGRPYVDTLNGSKYAKMKELRFKANGGVWRVAFAYDPNRHAILLIAGNKSGTGKVKFYKELIRKAEQRFAAHLNQLELENTA